ncbi:MAG: C40 family peptidase [Bacteroidetes bacterium]|nr:C40 family peptidase [Bacteroidota bacterium]
MYGICLLSQVPCRREASDKSEIVTYLLFGEVYVVLESTEKWLKIKSHFDAYESWICAKQHTTISEKEFNAINATPPALSNELVQVIQENQEYIPIVIGSSLPLLKDKKMTIGDRTFTFDGSLLEPGAPDRNKILEYAFMYLNAPYLWGGKSPFGIDCSGFTQMVYKLSNVNLPRDAYQQAEHGVACSFVEEAQAGDLAFFDNEAGKIVHVGIVMGNGQIIHASGKVRIDNLDHQGIFNKEMNQYTHRLRIIKNLF